jgi:FkbM family methyltransferase
VIASTLALNAAIRKLLIPIFQRVNLGDIILHHHWTGDKFQLHSFTHKGYWFYGRARNRAILERVRSLIGSADCILDVGGHIGYTAVYFSWLVGSSGHVYVFEHSPDNLTYLRRNVELCARRNITVVASASSDQIGPCTVFADTRTGQNSTIVPEYYQRQMVGGSTTFSEHATTIDQFVEENGLIPDFVKIDAEGAEAQILRGMRTTLRHAKPRMVLETSLNLSEMWNLLAAVEYKAFTVSGRRIDAPEQLTASSHVFAFHERDVDGPSRL